MGLSDPFESTEQGARQAMSDLGSGIAGGINAVTQQKQQKQKQQQAWANVQQMIGTSKQTNAVQDESKPLTDEEYLSQAEPILSKVSGKLTGSQINITGDSDPSVRRQQIDAILKPLGLSPQPKKNSSLDVSKMSGMGSGGYTSEISVGEDGMPKITLKKRDEESDSIKEQNLEMSKERLQQEKERTQDQESSRNVNIATSLNKQINPMNASRGSQLGKIGETTVRSKRALDLLNDPNFKINSQVLSGISSDMAGILQGGAPTVVGMSEQDYNTLQSTLSKGAQYLDAHPGDALPDDIRSYLTDTFNKLNQTGKFYIKNNLKTVEDLQKPWVSKNKDVWDSSKQDIYDTYDLDDSSNDAKNITKMTGTSSHSMSRLSDSDFKKMMQDAKGK